MVLEYNGFFITTTTNNRIMSSPVECEAFAAVTRLSLTLSLNLPNVVETDCLELFSCANKSGSLGDWRIYPFLDNLRRFQNLFRNCSWNWIRHEANGAATGAAKLAKKRLCLCN